MSQRINWTVESLGEKHRRGRMFIYLNSGLNVPPEVQVSENIQSIKRYRRKVRGWSIIFFFSKHLSNTSYEPGTVDTAANRSDGNPSSIRLTLECGMTGNKQSE